MNFLVTLKIFVIISQGIEDETQLTGLKERWATIEWLMDPYMDTDVPLLKIGEDFEQLDTDSLMARHKASRFQNNFKTTPIITTSLANISMYSF